MTSSHKAYKACLQLALHAYADRLAYLGYYKDGMYDFIEFSLNERDLRAFKDVINAAQSAGFDPLVDRLDWSRCNLPRVEGLSYLPHALEIFANGLLDASGRDPEST